MAIGQIIGGRLGAHLAIKNGAKLIRPVFIFVDSDVVRALSATITLPLIQSTSQLCKPYGNYVR